MKDTRFDSTCARIAKQRGQAFPYQVPVSQVTTAEECVHCMVNTFIAKKLEEGKLTPEQAFRDMCWAIANFIAEEGGGLAHHRYLMDQFDKQLRVNVQDIERETGKRP